MQYWQETYFMIKNRNILTWMICKRVEEKEWQEHETMSHC